MHFKQIRRNTIRNNTWRICNRDLIFTANLDYNVTILAEPWRITMIAPWSGFFFDERWPKMFWWTKDKLIPTINNYNHGRMTMIMRKYNYLAAERIAKVYNKVWDTYNGLTLFTMKRKDVQRGRMEYDSTKPRMEWSYVECFFAIFTLLVTIPFPTFEHDQSNILNKVF